MRVGRYALEYAFLPLERLYFNTEIVLTDGKQVYEIRCNSTSQF